MSNSTQDTSEHIAQVQARTLWLIAGVIGLILRIAIPISLYINGQREIAILIFISNILVYYADKHFHGK